MIPRSSSSGRCQLSPQFGRLLLSSNGGLLNRLEIVQLILQFLVSSLYSRHRLPDASN